MDTIIAFLGVLRYIVIYHIGPALILSSTTLLLVLGIIKVCRVERPSVRGFLFFVVLLKPLFILVQGTFPTTHRIYAPISPGLQLPDPMNFIPVQLWHANFQPMSTNMRVSLIVVLAAVGLFLFWRWRSYYLFCQRLSKQSSFEQKENQEFSNTLTKLQEKIGARAKLLITKTEYDSPFCVGVKDSVMVFPTSILADFTPKEKEAVLIHELIHIRERDTIRQWIPVVLKDLLVFSPFVHFAFARISMEREKRVDQATANYLNESISLSSALLKTAKSMTRQRISLPMTRSFLSQKFLRPARGLTERIRALINLPGRKENRLSWTQRILIGIGIALLLYPQVFLHIRVFPYTIQII